MTAAAKTSFILKIKRHTRAIVYAVFLAFLATACAPSPEAEPFIPPTAPATPTIVVTMVSLWTPTAGLDAALEPTATPLASSTVEMTPDSAPEPEADSTPTPEPCTANLTFLDDLTVPDGSSVNPGERIDKQWRVQNSGTCDWDARYRLKLAGGFPPLGAELSQQLFPARAGSEATIQIFFIAPPASGLYRSAWIAYGPDDQPFGEMIFIEFVVP